MFFMKKLILSLSTIAMIAFTSCEKKEAVAVTDAEEVAEASAEAATYTVDKETSNVEWRGYKVIEAENAESGHHGTMKLASGTVKFENNALASGDFVIDATSLESMDLNDSPEDKENLDGHLKSADFLDVENYPTATFNVTGVNAIEGDYNTEISGNFKMRDIEKNITFKANVNTEGDAVSINSEEFTINRKDFGIEFNPNKPGVFIKDNVTLRVNINGAKASEVVEETVIESVTEEPVEEELAH